jgi:GT2 family glycosyltransferase
MSLHAERPQCTVVIPSLNYGRFLEVALESVFASGVGVEVGVMDGGSTDESLEILWRWRPRLAWLEVGLDGGQAAAINAGIARARTPFVAWLNADDFYLPGGIDRLRDVLNAFPDAPAVYGHAHIVDAGGRVTGRYSTEPFDRDRLAKRCFISQPATLIRRECWEAIGGLDVSLDMALDYDLWWRLFRTFGPFALCEATVAASREHLATKTFKRPIAHYREAFRILRRHYGRVPLYWFLKAPVSVGVRLALTSYHRVFLQ